MSEPTIIPPTRLSRKTGQPSLKTSANSSLVSFFMGAAPFRPPRQAASVLHAPCVTAPFRPGADECCHSVFKVMSVVPPVATAAAPRDARFATRVRRSGQRIG